VWLLLHTPLSPCALVCIYCDSNTVPSICKAHIAVAMCVQRELRAAPAPVMEPFVDILRDLRQFAADNSSQEQVAALLWGVHVASLLEAHAVMALDRSTEALRGGHCGIMGEDDAATQLRDGLLALRRELRERVQPLLLGLLARDPTSNASGVASAAAIHAHVLLIWASAARLTDVSVPSSQFVARSADVLPVETCGLARVLASAVYLAQWARPTAADVGAAPWHDAFSVALEMWVHAIDWLSGDAVDAHGCDSVLSCAMAVAMRLPPGQVRAVGAADASCVL
jgi:hypothetical protein